MHRKDVVQLHDGAVVAFEEYGDSTGTPVIFCHGWPSSRTMAQLTDEPARSLGIRIISPDRPGISGSTMHLDRKLSDWPSLLVRLVDDLEIGDFRILAISGARPKRMPRRARYPGECGRSLSPAAGFRFPGWKVSKECCRFF